jgi:transcriptional regulator with XRE-family HTH domain
MARHRSKATSQALAQALVQAREAAGKTQKDAATAAGVDVDTIGAWEAARTDPKCCQVLALALFYGTAPSGLFRVMDPDFQVAVPCNI